MGTLEGYEADRFVHAGTARTVYRRGSGPAVIVLAEIPGITPKVIDFADRVVDLGCTAVLPHLFGVPGAGPSPLGMVRSLVPACVSREFSAWATNRTSPVVEWCRALARQEHERCGGPGVGVVGMCFTGNFALALTLEPAVLAPVMSQPSMPFGDDTGTFIHAPEMVAIQQRFEADDLTVLAYRFESDPTCPKARFDTFRQLLGERFVGRTLPDDAAASDWTGVPHSVVTTCLIDAEGEPTAAARDEIITFFRTRLAAP